MRGFFTIVLLFVTAGLIGCATTGGGTGSKRNVITLEEITTSNATTAMEIVAMLRPGLLAKDAGREGRLDAGATTEFRSEALVYVNGQRYGDKNSMRNIDASGITEIRYYPPDESVLKFGSNARGGVFDIIK